MEAVSSAGYENHTNCMDKQSSADLRVSTTLGFHKKDLWEMDEVVLARVAITTMMGLMENAKGGPDSC